TRGAEHRALEMTRSPLGACASVRARRFDQAASVFCCSSRNRGIEESKTSGTTENHEDTDADAPLSSNQIVCGKNPRPVIRYSVKTLLSEVTIPAWSLVVS